MKWTRQMIENSPNQDLEMFTRKKLREKNSTKRNKKRNKMLRMRDL